MVVHLSSVRVITHLNLNEVPPMLMHLGKSLAVMLAIKRLAGVAPEVDLRECSLHSPSQNMQIRQNPLWLWNPTSPEIRNRGYQWPPKIGHMWLPKTFFKKFQNKKNLLWVNVELFSVVKTWQFTTQIVPFDYRIGHEETMRTFIAMIVVFKMDMISFFLKKALRISTGTTVIKKSTQWQLTYILKHYACIHIYTHMEFVITNKRERFLYPSSDE